MLRALAITYLFATVISLPARAEPSSLVELFVSKNCPACPEAQENLVELAETDGPFVPLIWVIDYWDYVDGPDPMAIPESSARQRMYADALGIRGPYTPQLIVNGSAHVAGNRKEEVRAILTSSRQNPAPEKSDLLLTTTDKTVRLDGASSKESVELWIMAVAPMERYGLRQPNAVTHVDGPFSPTAGSVNVDYICESRCVAVVQDKDRGRVRATTVFGAN